MNTNYNEENPSKILKDNGPEEYGLGETNEYGFVAPEFRNAYQRIKYDKKEVGGSEDDELPFDFPFGGKMPKITQGDVNSFMNTAGTDSSDSKNEIREAAPMPFRPFSADENPLGAIDETIDSDETQDVSDKTAANTLDDDELKCISCINSARALVAEFAGGPVYYQGKHSALPEDEYNVIQVKQVTPMFPAVNGRGIPKIKIVYYSMCFQYHSKGLINIKTADAIMVFNYDVKIEDVKARLSIGKRLNDAEHCKLYNLLSEEVPGICDKMREHNQSNIVL